MIRPLAATLLTIAIAACRAADGSLPSERVAMASLTPDQVPASWRVWDFDGGSPTPDGRELVYIDWDMGDLRIRNIATGESRSLISNRTSYEEGYPFATSMSPDGSRVTYTWWEAATESYGLEVLDLATRERYPLPGTRSPLYVQADHWSPDGRTIVGYRQLEDGTSQIVLVPTDGGPVHAVRSLQWHQPVRINFSPDGLYIVFDVPADSSPSGKRDLTILSLATGAETRLDWSGSDDTLLGWDPASGQIVFLSDRAGTPGAWAIAFDEGRFSGEPKLVRPDFLKVWPIAFLPDGTFFYTLVNGGHLYIDRIDRTTGLLSGRAERLPPDYGQPTFIRASWSPDGEWIAYRHQLLNETSAPVSLHLYSVQSGEVKELRIPKPLQFWRGGTHHWSLDGRSITFGAEDRGRLGLYRIDVQTAGVERLLQLDHGEEFVGTSRGGTLVGDSVVYGKVVPGQPPRILVRDLRTGEESVLADSAGLGIPSPDGRWVVTRLRRDGDDVRIHLMPLRGGEPREMHVALGTPLIRGFGEAEFPRVTFLEWSADARSLVLSARPGVLGAQLDDLSVGELLALSGAPDAPARTDGPCPACPPYDLWLVPIDGGAPKPVGPIRAGNTRNISMDPRGTTVIWDGALGGTELWAMAPLPRN